MEQKIDFQEKFLGKRYTVSFPFELYMKMKAWFQHFDNQKLESVVWGKAEKKENTILITDIIIPYQEISGVSVDIDDEENTKDESVLGCNLSIHSHHTMGAFFSSKDESNITKWIADIHDVFVYGVYSGAQYKIIVYDPAYQYVYQPNVDIIYESGGFVEANKAKAKQWIDLIPRSTYRPALERWPQELPLDYSHATDNPSPLRRLHQEIKNSILDSRREFTDDEDVNDLITDLHDLYMEVDLDSEYDPEVIGIFKDLSLNIDKAIGYNEIQDNIATALKVLYTYLYATDAY